LAAAVDLVYKARKAGFKLGQHVSQHARQGNLFQLDDGATVADYNNAAVMMLADVMNDGRVTQLKKVLSFYNTQAADSAQGIGDMFAGGVKSKGQIINEVNELLNNGQEYDRRTPSVADGQGVGGEGGEQGDVAGPSHQGGAGSERGLSEAFDGLAAQLKTAEGEERKRVLGEMRDGIARFAEENGYPVPEFLLTRDDFLAAVPEKDRAKYVEWLDDGWHCPAYYEKGKVYYFVEGCDKFDKDVAETLAHEYTHADNSEFPSNEGAATSLPSLTAERPLPDCSPVSASLRAERPYRPSPDSPSATDWPFPLFASEPSIVLLLRSEASRAKILCRRSFSLTLYARLIIN
jgi:hypothetical protein